jgi:hypothetical protein
MTTKMAKHITLDGFVVDKAIYKVKTAQIFTPELGSMWFESVSIIPNLIITSAG